jgi:hypothetical protein
MGQFRRVRAYSFWLSEWLAGREDSNRDMANWIRMLSPVREESQHLFFVEIHRPFETLDFREPYRIRGVQSFGEKRAFRRIISRLCRSRVQSSAEGSLLLLGLIAREFTRRIRGFGQAGGGRGAGIEPSPTACRSHARKVALAAPAREFSCFFARIRLCAARRAFPRKAHVQATVALDAVCHQHPARKRIGPRRNLSVQTRRHLLDLVSVQRHRQFGAVE